MAHISTSSSIRSSRLIQSTSYVESPSWRDVDRVPGFLRIRRLSRFSAICSQMFTFYPFLQHLTPAVPRSIPESVHRQPPVPRPSVDGAHVKPQSVSEFLCSQHHGFSVLCCVVSGAGRSPCPPVHRGSRSRRRARRSIVQCPINHIPRVLPRLVYCALPAGDGGINLVAHGADVTM